MMGYYERVIFDPVKFRRKTARWLTWAALFAVAAAPRVAMMFTVSRRLDADESIVGLMAKHISEGRGVPFFFYGQNYGGGHVIEALFAAPLFRAFGVSEWAVHLAPVVFSVATIFIVYIFVRRLYGVRAGFAAAALLSVSTPYLESSLKADGYIETIFLGALALLLFQNLEKAYREGAANRVAAFAGLMGAALGLAWWSYDFALIYAAALGFLALRHGMMHPFRALVFAAGFLLGASPLIVFDLTHDFAHLRQVLEGGPGGTTGGFDIVERVSALFTRELPAFLTPDCVHNFVYPVPWYAWAAAGVLAVAVLSLIANRRRVHGALALVPLLFLAAYVVSGYAGRSPRYLLPLEPFLSIAVMAALSFLYGKRRHITRLAAFAVFIALAAGVGGGLAAIYGDDSILEGNVKTDPESLVWIVRYLESKDVKCVETTYFIKWKILFLSGERINATDVKARERETAYLYYENKGCPKGERPAFVLHKASRYRYPLAAMINREPERYDVFYTSDHLAVIRKKNHVPPGPAKSEEEYMPAEEPGEETDIGMEPGEATNTQPLPASETLPRIFQ